MVEYESTSRFPSPLDNDNNVEDVVPSLPTVQQQTKPKKSLPKVQPKRQLEDVLWIVQPSEEYAAAATQTTAIHSMIDRTELDVNSIWVEMLIHDQQEQGATAANKKLAYAY